VQRGGVSTYHVAARCGFCHELHTLEMFIDIPEGPSSTCSLSEYAVSACLPARAVLVVARFARQPAFCPTARASYVEPHLDRLFLVPEEQALPFEVGPST
jgi:hypothetical protein